MRGFTKLIPLFSFLALLSALFSRIDLPAFLAALLFGDFPDIGITPFYALRYPIPYLLLFFMPVLKKPGPAAIWQPRSEAKEFDEYGYLLLSFMTEEPLLVFFCQRSQERLEKQQICTVAFSWQPCQLRSGDSPGRLKDLPLLPQPA
ncbi:hypothetical protein [Arthrobacter sp. D3-16]